MPSLLTLTKGRHIPSSDDQLVLLLLPQHPDIPFAADQFDVILCVHVLEHVTDDRKAMSELLRILKPGGCAILQSPIDWQRERTFEDATVVAPKERERLFGQSDHVRVYGRDYTARLEQAGFTVTVEDYAKRLGPQQIVRCALGSDLNIFICTKVASRID